MLVSVVITTKNEEKNIGDLLESLVIQEKPFEVVIVDSESRDGTQNIIK
ncbi:MAG: glycosyl transferase family 2, partial [Euryarchaeota archaeon CG01_land_8_20_14_3_00_38_12]